MRKYILFLLLACLHLAARGQTIEGVDLSGLPQRTQAAGLQYWFDDDKGSLSTSQQINGTHLLDVSSLLTGLHTVHYQIVDNTGKVAVPYSALFLKTAQYELEAASGLQYWIDDDAQSLKKTSLQNGVSTIDVSTAMEGLHTLHFQILDSHGMPSAISSAIFMKMGKSMGDGSLRAERMLYWYDDEEQLSEAELDGGLKMLDASHLTEGLHTLHYQVLCNNGALTTSRSAFFFRVSHDTSSTKAHALRYWYDDQTTVLTAPISGGTQMLDVADLTAGLHVLHFQIVDKAGSLGVPTSAMFLKMDAMEELATAKSQRYWFDEDESQMRECAVANGIQELDVTGLSTGFHTLHYQLVDGAGNVTVPYSDFFMKMPECDLVDGKNSIIRYQYWLNDDSQLTTSEISKPSNPFQLISLIPMESKPIRSSCFHFEAKDGEPTIYAKNDIHFRFYDAYKAFSDGSTQFIDYKVSQKLTDITPLQTTQTFERPEENGIKWFSFEADKGDSVTFSSSLATSLQLFNEKGDICYEAQGSESVSTKGTHLTENGTYYLAVHDVTGHTGNSISLQFTHIGKFALLETSNPSLGVMPSVQILELDGNGFDNLKNVKLLGQGSIIMPDSISISARSKARLYFLFDGNEKLGLYDLILNFDDGEDARDIQRSNYVELAEPSFENIEIAISDPRAVADPYPVYIKVTNNSNIAYQAVPFYFAIDHTERMRSIQFMDFVVGCSEELYEAGLQLSFEYDSFMGNNIKTKVVPTIIPEILPGETLTFTLGVRTGAHQTFNVYAWTGKPWSLLIPETQDYISRHYSDIKPTQSIRRAPGAAGIFDGCQDDPCELAGLGPEYSECACGMALALGGTLGGIQNGIQNSKNKKARELYELNGLSPDDYPIRDRYLPSPEDLIWYWVQHCLPGKAGQVASNFNTGRQTMGNNPCQDPPPHTANPYNPGDPNEIHGYMSEAGSKYIRKEVLDVSYAIEFENDPELANVSAHKIVICDTLDISIFDPSTFRPTSVKIGNKSVDLEGSQNSIQTLDMRPEINAIAQIETEFDQQSGIAKWILSSLDPMSMEETYDIMQGILPINNSGNGVGFVNYNIQLKQPLVHGTSFANRASIVFDFENPILTPTWTNIVDAVAPTGSVIEVTQHGDSAIIICDGMDEQSGIWKYEVYTQLGINAPCMKVGECFADSAMISYEVFAGFDYGFCALAVDSAGNVEQKELVRELSLNPAGILGDVNGDNSISSDDVTCLVNYLLQIDTVGINISSADVNQDGEISVGDVLKLIKIIEDAQGQKDQSRQSDPIFYNSKQQETMNNMLHKIGINYSMQEE